MYPTLLTRLIIFGKVLIERTGLMMYYSPIKIDQKHKELKEDRTVRFPADQTFTLQLLSEYVADNETFSIVESDTDCVFTTEIVLTIRSTRFETDVERDARVAKEEKYMENYRKFHANKKG